MISGVFFILASCFCWGLVFVIPKFLEHFSPLEIALGRFFIFGAISAFLLFFNKKYLLEKSYQKAWITAFWFALLSTLVCYIGMVFCIRFANSAITVLIYGMSPVTIALGGNFFKKEFPFKKFLFPVLLLISGLLLTNIDVFSAQHTPSLLYLFGLFCGLSGLLAWSWYTIANHHFMERNKEISSIDWVVMMGSATFALVLLIGSVYVGLNYNERNYPLLFSEHLKTFLIGSVILGTLSSWVSFFLWNCGNARLSISLAGQLTIFEMVFGLCFIYLFEQRYPSLLETTGITLMIGGVLSSFKTLKKPLQFSKEII